MAKEDKNSEKTQAFWLVFAGRSLVFQRDGKKKGLFGEKVGLSDWLISTG